MHGGDRTLIYEFCLELLQNLIDERRTNSDILQFNITQKLYYTRKGVDIKKKKKVVRKMNLRDKNSKWAFTIIHTLKYILDQLKTQM